MASWRMQEAVRNIVVIGALGAGGYYGYQYLKSQEQDPNMSKCDQDRREMLEACEPQCAENDRNLGGMRDSSSRRFDTSNCLDECVRKRFGRALPVCSSRRRR